MGDARIRRNFVYQTIYRVITVVTPLITSPYLSRTLGAENLGVFSGTFAYANYFVFLAMLGVEYHGSRTIALRSENRTSLKAAFWGIYYVQLFASIFSAALYYGTVFFVFSERRRLVRVLQGFWIIGAGLDANWYFFGRRKFSVTVTRSLCLKVLTIILIFLFVKQQEDLSRYALIMSLGTLFSQAAIWVPLLREVGFSPPILRDVRGNLKPMVKLFLPVLALSAFHVMDKTMVDALSDELNGGCYYNVDKLINIPLGVCTGINTVMLPEISRLLGAHTIQDIKIPLSKGAELISMLACAIAFGLGGVASVFVPVFFGQGYELCVPLIYLFVPVMLLKALSDFIRQQYLIPSHHDGVYIKAVVIGALANLFINYFLILKFGAIGAAAATAVAEFLVLSIEIAGCMAEINFLRLILSDWHYYFSGAMMLVGVKLFFRLTGAGGVAGLAQGIFFGGALYSMSLLVYWRKSGNEIYAQYILTAYGKARSACERLRRR